MRSKNAASLWPPPQSTSARAKKEKVHSWCPAPNDRSSTRRDVREFASQMSSSLAIVARGERGNGESRGDGREGEEREREVENGEEERQMIRPAKKSEEL